jgi:hypothetical protein
MPRRFVPLALGLIFAALVAHALSYGLNVQDDAFISYRYAQNLVEGRAWCSTQASGSRASPTSCGRWASPG